MSDSVAVKQGSESQLSLEEDTITAKVPTGRSVLVGRAASFSDSKLPKENFHSTDELQDTLSMEDCSHKRPTSRSMPPATSRASVTAEDSLDDETIGLKKVRVILVY